MQFLQIILKNKIMNIIFRIKVIKCVFFHFFSSRKHKLESVVNKSIVRKLKCKTLSDIYTHTRLRIMVNLKIK